MIDRKMLSFIENESMLRVIVGGRGELLRALVVKGLIVIFIGDEEQFVRTRRPTQLRLNWTLKVN